MKAKFKVGDRVRCVDPDCSYIFSDNHPRGVNQLVYGKEYEVSSSFLRGVGPIKWDRVTLAGTDCQGDLGWNTYRFELIESAGFYIVHDETFSGVDVAAEFTIRSATEWIEKHGVAGHVYTIRESIERRKFEVVDKVQRELKAL